MDVADVYTQEIRRQSGKYHAAWVPEAQFELGSYGVLDGRRFVYQGSIAHLGIPFKTREGTAEAASQWSTAGSTKVIFSPQATIGGTKVSAKLDIEFSSEKAMFFSAAGCQSSRIDDMTALEKALIEKVNSKEWRKHWVVVTELIRSRATIVLVSGGRSAKATIEARADVPQIDLANASIELGVTSRQEIGYKATVFREITPLMELRAIATSKWWQFWDQEDPHLEVRRFAPEEAAIKAPEEASEGNPKLFAL